MPIPLDARELLRRVSRAGAACDEAIALLAPPGPRADALRALSRFVVTRTR